MKCVLTERHDSIGESNSGKDCRVTNIGYVSIGKQVEQMTLAGQRLRLHREAFDFADGVDDGQAPDPTMDEDFDLADASRIMENLRTKQQSQTVVKDDEVPSEEEAAHNESE